MTTLSMRSLSVVLAAGSLLACSSTPSTGSARDFMAQRVSPPGAIKIVTFDRTNGLAMDPQHYTIEFRALVEFAMGGNWDGAFNVSPPVPGQISFGQNVVVGDTAELTGRVMFEKTEAGWRPMNEFSNAAGKVRR